MSSWLASWTAAFRISRREVLRNRSRNILIVAMLMLPVLGVTALETVWNSANDLSTQERLTRAVGTADAWISRQDTQAVRQGTSLPTMAEPANRAQDAANPNYQGTQATSGQLADPAGILRVLPNATLLPETNAWAVPMHGPAGDATPQYTRVDLTRPELAGAFDVLSGRAPRTASELDLSPRTMREFGASIGSTITLLASSTPTREPVTFTVVGEMEQPGSVKADEVFALSTAPPSNSQNPMGWFVLNPGGVSWSQVQAMNKTGYVVTSREVALDPPPASQVAYNAMPYPFFPGGLPRVDTAGAAILAISVGIGLLEVVLLAGPAFAVSARRRERELALIGAAGADQAQLRRIVLADGLVLGAIAGLVGAGLGFGAGAAALPWLGDYNGALPGHLHVDVLRVVGVALLSIVLGLCAAWIPARSAARRDIFAALSNRRVAAGTRVRTERLVAGLLLIALGACGVLLERKFSPSAGAVFVVGGIAVIEVGGILCTPAVIAGLARLGRILPLGPRLALRDSARHTGRTTPAVAAMFAAVAGAVAAGAWFDSSITQARDAYTPALTSTQVGIRDAGSRQQAAQIVAKLGSVLPVTGSVVAQDVDSANASGTDQWQVTVALPPAAGEPDPGRCAAGTSVRPGLLSNSTTLNICGDGLFGTAMAQNPIGGPAVLKELTGIDDAKADAVLSEGGVVVFQPDDVRDGKATLEFEHGYPNKAKPGTTTYVNRYVTVPAVYENPQGIPNPASVISPALAQRMGVPGGTVRLVVDLRGHITASQQAAADKVLAGYGRGSDLIAESGYVGRFGVANLAVIAVALLLAIAAAAIATGLALADGRADHETLTAVGGSPWTRRWLAGSTALVITGLGIVIGVPLGFVIAAGLVRVSNLGQVGPQLGVARVFVVPWLNLGALVIAVPALTALGAMLLTRSKLPGARRIEY